MTAIAAICSALVLLFLVPPSGRLARIRPARVLPWPAWIRGRPGAMALATRARVSLACGAGLALVLGGGLGLVLGPLAAAVTTIGLGWLEPSSRRRKRLLLSLQLPATLDLLASALAAGLPPRSAAAAVAEVSAEPTASVLRHVTGQVGVGRSEPDAWRSLAAEPDWAPVWAAVGRDLARSTATGSSVGEILSWHADHARQRRRAALERAARTVGVKSVLPLMTCFLPAFILLGVIPIIAGLVLNNFR